MALLSSRLVSLTRYKFIQEGSSNMDDEGDTRSKRVKTDGGNKRVKKADIL